MKKIFYLLAICTTLFATNNSNIALPQNNYLDLDAKECDEACLDKLLKEKKYFTFMSKQQGAEVLNGVNKELEGLFNGEEKSLSDLQLGNNKKEDIKLAILVPQKKIGNYASSVVNSITAYLMERDSDFDIEVFNSYDESEGSLSNALNSIRQRGYKIVIAPLTQYGANYVAQNANDLIIFMPTINKKDIQFQTYNILYGGIDYEKQIISLLNYANSKVAIFSDLSPLSNNLNNFVAKNSDVSYQKDIESSQKINLKYILKGNWALQGASIFLNTPLIKSSLIASQLRVYDIKPKALLSTQINLNPLLLNLTQYADRRHLYLANSISTAPISIQETNALFNHNIAYDWVNYSTNVGMDYLYSLLTGNSRKFSEDISNHEINYNIKIMKTSEYGFYNVN